MTKVIVHQYVYVAHDKTRAFITIIDLENGVELAHKHYVSGGIPLFEVASDLYSYLIDTLTTEINPEEIQYRCNVLGGFNLVKKTDGYKRINVYNRFERGGDVGKLRLAATYKKLEEYEEAEEFEDV